MANDKYDVCSKSLGLLGEERISSFDDDTDASEQCGLQYELFIQSLMSMKDWYFLRTRRDLVEDGATIPVNEWTRAFTLPSDALGPPFEVFFSSDVGARPVVEGWERHGRHIYTNATAVTVLYPARVNETLWPPYFENLAVQGFAAQICTPITENGAQAERLRAVAFGSPSMGGKGGMFQMAAATDEIGRPTESLLDNDDPMAQARFGGRGY